MNNYLFRMPADTPPLTFARLRERCQRQNYAGQNIGKIGSTVTLYYVNQLGDDGPDPYVSFRLYFTTLARIYRDRVEFTTHSDQHMATREWLNKIATDNGLGGGVFRENFTYYLSVPAPGGRHKLPLLGQAFTAAPLCCYCGTLLVGLDGKTREWEGQPQWRTVTSKTGTTVELDRPAMRRVCPSPEAPGHRHWPQQQVTPSMLAPVL
jgi:hypothetical protein